MVYKHDDRLGSEEQQNMTGLQIGTVSDHLIVSWLYSLQCTKIRYLNRYKKQRYRQLNVVSKPYLHSQED